ncbi:MAG: hypothetical protein LBV18_00675 [Alistipes sp.]|nr:hypothetical protein [Alistipes sp.]
MVRWTGLSVNSFALSIGLNRGENLYQIKRGNNGISGELARMISEKYPGISRAWLIAGEGEMFLAEGAGPRPVPFYNADVERFVAAPGRFRSSGSVLLPGVDDADFAALYNGRAMGWAVPAGSTVLVRRVAVENLIPGGDYVVVVADGAMMRRVRREAGSDQLRLLAVDADNFDEIRVNAASVRELYLVLAVVINKII